VRPWLIAARPPTLLASVAPVIAGCGLAMSDGVFRLPVFAATLAAAVLLNLAANFANDASDAARGADTSARIGPPRAVATGLLTSRQVWTATAVTIGLAAACGVYLALTAGWIIIAIGVASVLALLTYTGGPAPYGYRAMGELSVFAFFGPVAVVGSRFVHDASAPIAAWLLAIPIGFVATAILVANNVRDIDTDRAAGKKTLAVVIGRSATRRLYATLILGAFATATVTAAFGWIPRWCLLVVVALPLAVKPLRIVATESAGGPLVTALKATARLHAVVGLLLGIGAALG